MSMKELILRGPELSRVPFPGRYRRANELVWGDEISNPESAFARHTADEDDEEGRIDVLFGWLHLALDSDTAVYVRQLANLCLLRHYIKEHGRSDLMDRAAKLEGSLSTQEAKHPEVAKVFTVEAAAQGFWT